MQIEYKNKNIRRICLDVSFACKQYGKRMAEQIAQRIDEIAAAESVEEMIQFNIGRCHQLKGERKNQFAIDLVHPKRLILIKECNGEKVSEQIVRIIEIVDYH